MEPTEQMVWVTIDYNGIEMEAANFLDGMLVRDPLRTSTSGFAYCPGWYIQKPTGDMDGPAFRKRKTKEPAFAVRLVAAE